MKNFSLLSLCYALLIVLFIYTATVKLTNLPEFRGQMALQALPDFMKPVLIWLLPALELLAAAALSFDRTRLAGYGLSAALMLGFTMYVALVLSGTLGKAPCACGGVISSLGWRGHLVFNIFFLLLSVTGIVYTYRERRVARQQTT